MPFKVIRNEITQVKADAIVNTANPKPVFARGTDSAIYRAAGADWLLKARQKFGRLSTGQAVITPAFSLQAKYIIHTVAPIYTDGNHGESDLLRSCYENSLQLAAKYRCKSIAFPLIGTGACGYPKDNALQTAMDVIRRFLDEHDMMIWLVVFDQQSFLCSKKLVDDIETYIDEKTVRKHLALEYEQDDESFCDEEDFEECGELFKEPKYESTVQQVHDLSSIPNREKRFSAAAPKSRSLDDVLAQVGETFQERLFRLIDEKGKSDVEVYRKANLDRKLFSKIRSNKDYHPKKMTALALAIALELNLDQTKDLIGRAEFALSPGNKFDLVIQYFIEHEIYDMYLINVTLFQYGLPLLGD